MWQEVWAAAYTRGVERSKKSGSRESVYDMSSDKFGAVECNCNGVGGICSGCFLVHITINDPEYAHTSNRCGSALAKCIGWFNEDAVSRFHSLSI